MSSFFVELSLVMLIVIIVSYLFHRFKQPLLVGYIFAGIIVGPLFLNILTSSEGYETFSHIGIALLLFIVGLHLNLKLIKEVGLISLITGLGQVFFTSFIGFIIAKLLGFSLMASLLIAVGLTFSSTIIIVKLLSDKNDINKLYGKISMGFLIVQDFVAVIILMILSSVMSIKPDENVLFEFSKTFGITVVAIALTYFLSKKFLPKILDSIAKSTELLFIFIIAWCFGISSIFYYFGSIEVGALLAGIALASSSYQYEISSRIRPMRDFFIVMFFILLGSNLFPVTAEIMAMATIDKLSYIFASLGEIIVPVMIFSVFILIGNPLIVLILMTMMRYSSKTGFMAGLTVAQISEFSLILVMIGNNAGFLSATDVSIMTFVGIITILCSTYMIIHNEKLYSLFEPFLKKFERKNKKESDIKSLEKDYEIIIFGYNRIGFSLLKSIKKLNKDYLLVDYDPSVISKLQNKNFNCIFGDASDADFISDINLKSAKMIISTIPEYETNSLILKLTKNHNKKSINIVTARNIDDALDLYSEGADYVILPHYLGGDYVSALIEKYDPNLSDFIYEKVKHISDLKERKEHGLENLRKS